MPLNLDVPTEGRPMPMNLAVPPASVNKISKPLAVAADRIGRAVQYEESLPCEEWRWALLETSDIPGVARAIGVIISMHDWRGEPRPTRKRLAHLTGFTERAIQKNMKHLSPWLETSGEPRRRGRATEYTLKVPDAFLSKFCPQTGAPIQVPSSWRGLKEREPRAPSHASPSRLGRMEWDTPPPMAPQRENHVLPIAAKGEPYSPYRAEPLPVAAQKGEPSAPFEAPTPDFEASPPPMEPRKGEPGSPHLKQLLDSNYIYTIRACENLEEFQKEKNEVVSASEEVSEEAPVITATPAPVEIPVEVQEAPEPAPTPEPLEATEALLDAPVSTWRAPELHVLRRLLTEAAGDSLASEAGAPGLLVLSVPMAWLSAGCSLHLDVIPVVAAAAKRVKPGAIKSWVYYEAAVLQAAAARTAPKKLPEAAPRRQAKKSGITAKLNAIWAG